MSRNPALRGPAQKAVDCSLHVFQKPYGAWRYDPKKSEETSVTGWFIMQLKSARIAGLKVDNSGFDMMDRKLLAAVIKNFDGGPVGVDSLAAAIGEERGTIEDVLEPFLIQQGFLMRTPRGRVATRAAYLHFGMTPKPEEPIPPGSGDLFK